MTHAGIARFLNELIELELAMTRAYEEAIEGASSMELRQKLTGFMGDHHKHVNRLDALVIAYGGKPDERRDLRGYLRGLLTAIVAFGDYTALLAMRRNEEMSARTYRAALREQLPDDVRAALEDNYSDEQQHLAWIVGELRGSRVEA